MGKKHEADKEKLRERIQNWRRNLLILFGLEIVVLLFSNETVSDWPVFRGILKGMTAVFQFLLSLVGLVPAPEWMVKIGASPVMIFLANYWAWLIPLMIVGTVIYERMLSDRTVDEIGEWHSGLRREYADRANQFHDEMKALCTDAFMEEPGVRLQVFTTKKAVDKVIAWNHKGFIRIDGVASGPIVLQLCNNRAVIRTDYGVIPLERNIPTLVSRDENGDVVLKWCAVTWLGGNI